MGGVRDNTLSKPQGGVMDGPGAGKERPMTTAEARFLLSALAYPGGPENPRRELSGLARSTYHSVRARVDTQGWIQESFVPDPAALGYHRVTFLLGRVFAERRAETSRRLSETPGVVSLWLLPQTIFAVAFHKGEEDEGRFLARAKEGSPFSQLNTLSCGIRHDQLPVYFDYEGLWSHLIGNESLISYPTAVSHREERGEVSVRDRFTMEETVRTGSFRRGMLGLPRRGRGVVSRQLVGPRVFLRPWRLPVYQGRAIDQFVFVTGLLTRGTSFDLLSALTAEARAYPFLFATDGTRVLLGAMGQTRPVSPGTIGRRRPVLEVLGRSLTEIENLVEPTVGCEPVIEHAYGTLFPPRSPLAKAPPPGGMSKTP